MHYDLIEGDHIKMHGEPLDIGPRGQMIQFTFPSPEGMMLCRTVILDPTRDRRTWYYYCVSLTPKAGREQARKWWQNIGCARAALRSEIRRGATQ